MHQIKFDGFEIVSIQCRRELRQKFTPIDVIYKPVMRKTDPIHCFATLDNAKSYYSVCSNNTKSELSRAGYAYNCYYRDYPNLVRTQVEIISGFNYLVRIVFEK